MLTIFELALSPLGIVHGDHIVISRAGHGRGVVVREGGCRGSDHRERPSTRRGSLHVIIRRAVRDGPGQGGAGSGRGHGQSADRPWYPRYS